jgi:hypothetical protein
LKSFEERPMSDPKTRRMVQIVVGLLLAQALLVAAFVIPGHDPEPHGVPVGVAGPPPALAAAEESLATRGDAFEVHRYPGAAQARAANEDREVYGGILPAERRVLVASAASPVVAQLLQEAVRGLRVEDVVRTDPEDPRGATLNLLFLPLIVIYLPLAALLGRLGLRRGELLAVLAGFAALSGLLVVALVGGAIGALPGPYLALSGVAALTVLAIALPAAGFMRLLGPGGIGLAALLFLVIGQPGSGNASAPELLPAFWRVVGQLLPPGAGGQALRNTAYFDGAALGRPLLVLLAWAAVGALLVLLARSRAPEPAADTARAAVAA